MSGELRAPYVERPERLLVIVAHPDDADFGPAAAIAGWIRAGTVAALVCCTSGELGGQDPETDPLGLARLREEEQRAAAGIVGYEAVTFLHAPDGALANDLALRYQLVRVIRSFRPDAVATMDPTVVIHEGGHIQHTDHRAAAQAALDAVYPAARNPMAFPDLARGGLAAHVVPRLYLFWTDQPTAWVDVSSTLDLKIRALKAHASQLTEPEEIDAWVRQRAAEAGEQIGTEAAETFRVVEIG